MSETPAVWRSSVSCIIVDPAAPRLLLLADADGWRLPQITLERQLWPPEADLVLVALRDQLGITATIVRCADSRTDRDTHRVDVIYVIELREDCQPPTDSLWIEQATLDELPLAQPEQRPVLSTYLAEQNGAPTPPLRTPWAYPGWHVEAVAWIEAQLTQLGYTLLAPIEQIKSWCLSCILRAQTSDGPVYFKIAARLPLFADEPQIMAALSARYPALIPTPLAIDRERGWLLLADVGAELRELPDQALWTAALSAYGQMQRSTTADVGPLLAGGCIDRSLTRLAAQIEPLLQSAEVQTTLTADEIARLHALAPELRARCEALDSYGLPTTLVHGDLHGGNIAIKDGRCTIFDWTDACIAHPFIDLPTMLEDIPQFIPDPAAQTNLRDSYLAQWSDYGSPDRLLAAWSLAAPLAALHQAVSYHGIITSIEASERPMLDWGIPYWLRLVLQNLAAEQAPTAAATAADTATSAS